MVVPEPVPVVIAPPGFRVTVHVPLTGKPFNTTLPVDKMHVGCVMVPMVGGDGRAFTVRV